MPLAKKMMGGGLSSGGAKAINGDIATALTAAGTTQATAKAINSGVAVFGTVAASSGAILPACEISDDVWVYNGGANALTLYPDSGANINEQAANAGIQLATATGIKLKRITSTKWIGILSA